MDNFALTVPASCDALESVVQNCSLSAVSEQGQFRRAFLMAAGVNRLREMITDDMMKHIMPLMNTALGFRTDKDPTKVDRDGKPVKPYPVQVVKECLIEAVLRGLAPVGNQFNIIADRCYVTKEGFTALLKKVPGLSDLHLTMEVPKINGDRSGAVVRCSASWKLNGAKDHLEPRDIPVKLNAGMGVDAALGKAERKAKALIYAQVTGTALSDGEADAEDDGAIPTTATKPAEDPNEKLKAAAAKQEQAALKKDPFANINPKHLAQARGQLNISAPAEKLTTDQIDKLIAVASEIGGDF